MEGSSVWVRPALLPDMGYIQQIIRAEAVYLDGTERFQKQTERSRYHIATSAGPLRLTVPLKQGKTQLRTGEVLLSYDEPWPRKHLRSIKTAYGAAPYYIYFIDGLEVLLHVKYERLIDMQAAALQWLCNCFRSQTLVKLYDGTDQVPLIDLRQAPYASVQPYHQVFENQCGFLPGLSALDYLFNEGPDMTL